MGNLSWTIHGSHPRLHARSTDKTAITTRTTTAASWQTVWNNDIISRANTLVGMTDSQVASDLGTPSDSVHMDFMVLALAGWITGTTSYHTKLLGAAKSLAQNPDYWDGFTPRRYQLLAMAYAYTFLRSGVITFSDADRKICGDEMIAKCTGSGPESEKIDGHAGGNLMTQLHVGIALAGESGTGFNYTTSAAAIINTALDFLYGATPGGSCRLDAERYYCSDGGSGKGTSYNHLSQWYMLFALNAVWYGFDRSTLTLNGDPYDPWVDEVWVSKAGEWWLNAYFRGDGNYLKINDTAVIKEPWFKHEARGCLGILINRGGANLRKPLRWLYDQIQTFTVTAPPNGAGQTPTKESRADDIVLWDPADSANASQTPEAAGLSKSRLFSPVGDYFHRNTWSIPESTLLHISVPEFWFAGHTHLNLGAIQGFVKGDCAFGQAGVYSTATGAVNEDFGGDHHRKYLQQTGSCSGVILIDDGAATPHKLKNLSGITTSMPAFLGGQYALQYNPSGTVLYDPTDINDMRNAAGGLAWRRSGSNGVNSAILRHVVPSNSSYDFLHADIRRSYLLNHVDFDAAADRTRRVEMHYAVIKDVWQHPILLCMARVHARNAAHAKRQVWHVHTNNGVSQIDPQTLRLRGAGARGRAKVYFDVYTGSMGFTCDQVGGGAVDSNGYAANQWAYVNGGTAYKPTNPVGTSDRKYYDLQQWSFHVRPVVAQAEVYFFTAVFMMEVGQEPPSYSWVENPNYLGINFSGREFLLHKTNVTISTTSDTTPPDPPTLVTLTPGQLGKISGTLNPSTAPDTAKFNAYYRKIS